MVRETYCSYSLSKLAKEKVCDVWYYNGLFKERGVKGE